jgi:hypothetical protein
MDITYLANSPLYYFNSPKTGLWQKAFSGYEESSSASESKVDEDCGCRCIDLYFVTIDPFTDRRVINGNCKMY